MKRFVLLSCGLLFAYGCSGGDETESPSAESAAANVSAEGGNSQPATASANRNDAGTGGATASTNANNTSPWGANSTGTGGADAAASNTEEEAAFASIVAQLARSAEEHVRRGYFDAAIQARTEIVQRVAAYYGADAWQTRNAQLALDHTKRVIELSPEQKLTYDAINEHDAAGQAQTRVGNADRAIGEFRLATKMAEQLWGPDSHVVGNLIHKEALVHQAKGSFAAAEQLFLQAMDIRKRSLGETHPDYSTSINALGVLYHRWGQLEKAEVALKDAIKNVELVWGTAHPEYATARNNLGMLYNSMQRFDEAIAELKHVAELRKGFTEEPNALYGHALFNLGSVYYQAQRYDEALPVLEESLVVLEPFIGRKQDISIMLLNNLAMSYMSKQRYVESEELLNEVAETIKARYGAQTTEYAQAQHNIGVLYLNQEQYQKAEQHVVTSLQIREQIGGREAPGLVTPLKDLATIYEKTNRAAEAAQITARVEALAARQNGNTIQR